MKKDGYFAKFLQFFIDFNKDRVKKEEPSMFLRQKNQLWFGLMNIVDDDLDPKDKSTVVPLTQEELQALVSTARGTADDEDEADPDEGQQTEKP